MTMSTKAEYPKFNIKSLLTVLDNAGTAQKIPCIYCGAGNPTQNGTWICLRCENANMSSMNEMRVRDQITMQTIISMNEGISSGDFESAILLFKGVLQKYNEPTYWYRYGLLLRQYSNYEVSSIKYDRQGFMEENSVHRLKASALESQAKLAFNKAISACQAAIARKSADASLYHAYFMCSVKLGDFRIAKRLLETSDDGHADPQLVTYQRMVFSAELGKNTDVANNALELITGNFSQMNCIYYLAWSLLRAKKYREAEQVTEKLANYVDTDNVEALQASITKAMEL